MNSSKLQKNVELETKPEELQKKSEAIEPHEITANMDSDQISRFADLLIELMKRK